MSDLTSPEGVQAHMRASTSEDDWDKRCLEVKEANGGDYPSFWHEAVLLSGLMNETLDSGSTDIKISPFRPVG